MKPLTWFVLLAALALPAAAGAQTTEEKRFTIPTESSPSIGPADAPVTIVEFIDFQ
jgi:protein-disulfide isomerase